jgi:hypothetical protein
MNLKQLVNLASDKDYFLKLEHFTDFAVPFLEFAATGLQAVIVSQNEPRYNFWQYGKEGDFNVTRPINSELMLTAENAGRTLKKFSQIVSALREPSQDTAANRVLLNSTIYTLQQCVGAALDGLGAGESNKARKLNGDLFERLIRFVLIKSGVSCTTGSVKVPVTIEGKTLFQMSFQHDLIIKEGELVKAIGSVKTSSKDRLDKVFMDKFMFNRLTSKEVPHVAIFLNDVQRKKVPNPREYGVSGTFLPGHFKAYTVKLNPLDGVYYCDIRPNMRTEPIIKDHIRTFDHFLFTDVWKFMEHEGALAEVRPCE